ncbi:hypothetical protein ACPPVW_15055 [Leifsonia sp. McL0607]|uniref:hypothetical protein n=1 Tax=Leifsonia sp. McL0607 TaxID=3415672 RepID=UPI003CE88389
MPSTPEPSNPPTGLKRRTLVGAAAWTAPAIVLVSTAPAYAASTLGVIWFVDPEDIIGSGYTATLTVQLTVPDGKTVPTNVSVTYGTAGIVSGPSLVPTGGKTLFTFEVTALDVNGSTDITVSAPDYVPATTTITVTFDNSGIWMMSAFTFGVISNSDTISPGGVGTRTTNASGFLVDSWTGNWDYASTSTLNTLRPAGQLSRGDAPTFTAMRGRRVEWRLDVATTGSPHLVWAAQSGFAFSDMPIGGTFQTGTAGPTGLLPAGVAARRKTLTTTSNPGGLAIFIFTFPRFPHYAAKWTITY